MKAREYIRQNMNVPNVLTLIRLLLVPVYIALFAMGDRYAALTVFLLASLTDMLDGQIARKYGLVTDFGKLMDPLADKIMVVTAMFRSSSSIFFIGKFLLGFEFYVYILS